MKQEGYIILYYIVIFSKHDQSKRLATGSFCVPVPIVSLSQRVIHSLVFLSTSCKMCENKFCTFFLKCFLNLIWYFSVQCQDDVSSPFFKKKTHQYTIKCAGKIYVHTVHTYKICQNTYILRDVNKSTQW